MSDCYVMNKDRFINNIVQLFWLALGTWRIWKRQFLPFSLSLTLSFSNKNIFMLILTELLELLCGFSKDPSHHRVESTAMEIREITAPGQRIYELGRYSFFDIPNTGRADGRHVIVWTRIGGKYFITLQSINPITWGWPCANIVYITTFELKKKDVMSIRQRKALLVKKARLYKYCTWNGWMFRAP